MIKVRLGNIAATLDNRTWTSDSDPVQRLLTAKTALLHVHGGVPDPDEAIYQTVAKDLPLQLLTRSPAAPPGGADRLVF